MIKGYSSNQKTDEQQYQTLQRLPAGKSASDMVPKALYSIQALDFVADSGTTNSITLAGHTAVATDVIRMTSGALDGTEVAVKEIKGDEIILTHKFASAIAGGDTFMIMKYITLTITKDGELSTSSGPIQFVKDGAVIQVQEDSVDPANNVALPVKLTGVNGDVIINAGDLQVQLSHTGANPDSTQIGDGTNLLGITASNEAKVKDTDVLAEALLLKTAVAKEAKQDAANLILTAIAAKDFSTEVTLASLEAKASTEAKQDVEITALGSLLTELALKADLTETQPVSVASLPLPTGSATEATLASVLAKIIAAPATEAKQDAEIVELQAILAKIITAPATEAKQDTEITALGSILAKIIAAPATEAKQDTGITALGDILAKIIAAPSTEAKQDAIIVELGLIKNSSSTDSVKSVVAPFNTNVSNIPAVGDTVGLEIIASTAVDFKKIQTIEDIGEYIGLYTGASGALSLLCVLPIAGGIVEIDVPTGTRLSLKHLKATVIDTDTYFSANLLG
jgi:hypothetical protein